MLRGAHQVERDERIANMRSRTTREKVCALCLALPGASREDHGSHSTYFVRKKAFAYYLDDHHGDGIVCVAFSAGLGEQAQWMALDPERYLRPAYIGARGWTSLRLDKGKVDWNEVGSRLSEGYLRVAPKTLARLVTL